MKSHDFPIRIFPWKILPDSCPVNVRPRCQFDLCGGHAGAQSLGRLAPVSPVNCNKWVKGV